MIKGKAKTQIAGSIFIEAMTSLKNLLKQAEDRYDGNTESQGYKWYKSFVMDQVYQMLEKQLSMLEKDSLVKECGCGASVKNRNGWKPCVRCNGSGYTNTDEYNDFLYVENEVKKNNLF